MKRIRMQYAELAVTRERARQIGAEGQKVVPAAGVEPATFRSGGERSNPLSYAGLNPLTTKDLAIVIDC